MQCRKPCSVIRGVRYSPGFQASTGGLRMHRLREDYRILQRRHHFAVPYPEYLTYAPWEDSRWTIECVSCLHLEATVDWVQVDFEHWMSYSLSSKNSYTIPWFILVFMCTIVFQGKKGSHHTGNSRCPSRDQFWVDLDWRPRMKCWHGAPEQDSSPVPSGGGAGVAASLPQFSISENSQFIEPPAWALEYD
jgi:hypothetical protein